MTTETEQQKYIQRHTDSEIDLRQYLDILFHWWKEGIAIIVFTVLLGILIIFGMRLFLSSQYIASADVAIVRTLSDVNFDERFRTTEEELGTDTSSRSARRSALLGLVTTGAIAQKVIDELGPALSEAEQIPAYLVQVVEAEAVIQSGSRSDSDLIRIRVTVDDPERAALIANSWARNYVREINAIYSEVPDDVLASIQKELATAEQEYLTAQTSLEQFISENRIDELSSLVSVLQQQVTQEVSLQQAMLAQWQKAQERLQIAQALFAQIETGGDGAVRSALPALQVLKISTFGMSPDQLQIELREFPEINAEAMLIDITGLIEALQSQIQTLELQIANDIEELRPTVDNTKPIFEVMQELGMTKAALEAEQAKQRQLNQQRDLDWETYRTLRNKVAELNLTRAAASSEVRVALEAVIPLEPTRRIALSTGILVAGSLGFFVALFVVIVAAYLGYEPLFSRSTTQKK